MPGERDTGRAENISQLEVLVKRQDNLASSIILGRPETEYEKKGPVSDLSKFFNRDLYLLRGALQDSAVDDRVANGNGPEMPQQYSSNRFILCKYHPG